MNTIIPQPRFTVTFDPEFQPKKPGLYYFVNAALTEANKENAEAGIASMLDALYVSGRVPEDRLQQIVYHPANEGCRRRVRSRGINYVGPTTGSRMAYVVEGSDVVTAASSVYIPTLLLVGATLRAVNLEFAKRIDRDDTQQILSRLMRAVSSVQGIAQRLGAEPVTWEYTADKQEGVILVQPCLVNRSTHPHRQSCNVLRFKVTENGWLIFDLSAHQRDVLGAVFDWNDLRGLDFQFAPQSQRYVQIVPPQQEVWLKVGADLDVLLFNEARMQEQAVSDLNVHARAGAGMVDMFRRMLRNTVANLERALSTPVAVAIEESTNAQVRREVDRLRSLLSSPITVNEGDAQAEESNDPIIGVAVKQGDLVVALPKPYRHCDCIRYAVETLRLTAPIGQPAPHQGFYTASGRFLNRQEAFKHVKRIGQPLVNPEAHAYLFSEDLW